MLAKIAILSTAFFLSACGPEPVDPAERSALENSLSTQLDAVDKAKSVEESLQEAADRRAEEIRKKGG